MSQELVSVIIPNYNSLEFISETLNSVFNQSYPHIEIIVVDDGSTDGSFELISRLDNRNLTLVKNTVKGACAARNMGIGLAKGKYIQFLDSDDLLDDDKIKDQVKLLRCFENRVAVCSTKHFNQTAKEGTITDTPFLFSTSTPHEFLLNLYGGDGSNQNMVAQHAWLAPKEVINKAGFWDESLIKDQDGEFFCRVVMASEGICYAENSLCYYRKHKKARNISSGKSINHLLSQMKALNSKSTQLAIAEDTKAYKNAMALQYKIIAIDAYPEFKTIYNTAITKVKQFGGSDYEPILGGNVIEFVKSLFGWRTAKAFSVFVHKICKH